MGKRVASMQGQPSTPMALGIRGILHMDEYSESSNALHVFRERSAMDCPDHLLKVVASINRDATETWAQLWGEFKPHVTSSGAVLPSMEKGFVPACGWTEFMERLWLLKHYLDSIARVCQERVPGAVPNSARGTS